MWCRSDENCEERESRLWWKFSGWVAVGDWSPTANSSCPALTKSCCYSERERERERERVRERERERESERVRERERESERVRERERERVRE